MTGSADRMSTPRFEALPARSCSASVTPASTTSVTTCACSSTSRSRARRCAAVCARPGPGERVALIVRRPLEDAPGSVYADECPGYQESGRYPESFRHRQQVLRSYTAAGDMLDARIADGQAAETAISELLAAPQAAVVHSRNVRAGCFMFAIRRR